MNSSDYLIIGNSAAAVGAVSGIRAYDPEGSITIIAREGQHTYSRPLISYLLAGRIDSKAMPYRPADFYHTNKVQTLLGIEVTRIDPSARTVKTSDGQEFTYGKLLIATGAEPIIPKEFAGLDAQGMFTFTTWDETERIAKFIESSRTDEPTRAVVVGGGLIGLKAVEALHERALKVTMVELADRILSATFDKTASDLARAALERAGVDVRCGTTVTRVHTDAGKVSGVTLRDGSEVPCKLIVVAVGVAPDKRIVEGSGIETDRGILVDDSMRTTADDVYAAGDVAQAREFLSGQKRSIAIFPIASRQGFVAGSNMAGAKRDYTGGLAKNSVEICGLPTVSVGLTTVSEADGYEVLTLLDERKPLYRKVVLKDNRIVGMIFVGQIERAGIFTGLIRQGTDVSSFKDLLLTDEFGLISLPVEYRKHMVSGAGIEV